jgi:nitroimidazol reductase NimA-like FMN-containing flavoprotein (pyridoxamine 5'-phosphate oxidase superfamily)
MESETTIRKRLKKLLSSQRLAVLATHSLGQPYGSLVSFAVTDDLKEILFATIRSTRKYANLSADARVAMVIDSRSNRDTDIHRAVAVTVTGRAEEVVPPEKEPFLKLYLKKHPYLKEFVQAPTCALLRVRVESYYFVSRFQDVTEIHVL